MSAQREHVGRVPSHGEPGGLPNGWALNRIEEIFAPLEDGRTLHQGWSPQCEKGPSPSEEVWGVLRTTSIQAGEFQPEHNKLLPSTLAPRPVIEVKEGDILITCAGPRVRCGVACLVRQTRKRLMMSGKMYRFRVDADRTDSRYVEAYLQTEQARLAIDKMKTGSSDSGLNLTHERFRQLPIPVAPFPEQRRIVAVIEKQFTRLEAGVAALRRVQVNLKRYRAAVLKAACAGQLVPTEAELVGRVPPRGVRAKTKNAASGDAAYNDAPFETGEQLLKRILAERRQHWTGRGQYKEPAAPDTANLPPLPAGWTWATMPQLGELNRGKSKHRPRDDARLYGGPYPFIQTGDIRKSGGTIQEHHQTYSEFGLQQSRLWPEGTLCITIAANIAETGILKFKSCFPDSVVGFTHDGNPSTTRYVEFFIRTAKDKLAQFAPATAQKNINLDVLQKVAVPLPPLAEQTRIVTEVERRLSVVEELESVVSANLQRATRLRQSILQKAFTGELV